jgi:hypothetical protein
MERRWLGRVLLPACLIAAALAACAPTVFGLASGAVDESFFAKTLYPVLNSKANSHKNAGLAMIAAGHAGDLKTGLHTRVTGTVGDPYLTLAEEVVGAKIGAFPTGDKKLTDIV